MTRVETFDVVLRGPGGADAAAIRSVLYETWIATYTEIFGPEKTAALANKFFKAWAIDLATRLSPDKILLADHENEVVGVLFARHGSFGGLFVDMLYVHPTWQRLGIGTALLQRLCELFAGASCVRLEVLAQNIAAIRFYRSLGFRQIASIANAQGTGAPAILVEKTNGSLTSRSALPAWFRGQWLNR